MRIGGWVSDVEGGVNDVGPGLNGRGIAGIIEACRV